MTRPHRAWRLAAAGAAAMLVLTACGGDEDGDGGDTAAEEETPTGEEEPPQAGGEECPAPPAQEGDGELVFGSLLPRTGDLAFLGPPEEAGVQLAVDEMNAAGGVLGQDVRIVWGDSGDGSPDIAPDETDKLLNAGADAILGAASSSVSVSVLDKITSANTLQMSPANTSTAFDNCDDNGYYFRTSPSDVLQGAVMADLVAQDGHSNLAILFRQEAYGQALADNVEKVFTEAGGNVVEKVPYTPEATSWTNEVQTIAAADPDAIVVIGFEETTSIVPEMISNNIGPADKQVYFVDGNLADWSAEFDPGTLQGVRGTFPGSELGAQFRDRLLEADPNLEDFTYGPEAYDATILLGLAAIAGEDDSGATLAANLHAVSSEGTECGGFEECAGLLEDGEDIDYEGVSGPINFNQWGSPSAATIGIYEYKRDNTFENVDYIQGDIS
ncbi:MAG: ABC transporter substrate-binding protein [Propionibacteriales bacterium]|nr:ABC transporter substrate-binding protein [Propionibacteriales bacterium]